MRKLLFVVAVSILGACAVGCGPKPVNTGYTDDTPDEIGKLIRKEYNEAIAVVGTAVGPEETIAKNKAVMQARAEISREFKVQVDALQKSYEEAVNNKALSEYSQVMEQFTTLELVGSDVVKSMIRKERNGSYSAKVLVVLSAEQFKGMVDQRMSDYTSFKASKAYKDLEGRVEREKLNSVEGSASGASINDTGVIVDTTSAPIR